MKPIGEGAAATEAPEQNTAAGAPSDPGAVETLGGLPLRTLAQIQEVWRRFPQIRWLKLYGSRALGRQRPGSDIDLAFSSEEDCSAALAAAFEELPTPYLVDVTHWESLRHEGLRDHIARVGLELQRG